MPVNIFSAKMCNVGELKAKINSLEKFPSAKCIRLSTIIFIIEPTLSQDASEKDLIFINSKKLHKSSVFCLLFGK